LRIISGSKKGFVLNAPKNLPVRPTTDMAKESLFNILENNFHLEKLDILDLFAGTGNISLEFASRGAKSVTAVDKEKSCANYIRQTADVLGFENINVIKQDCFHFLINHRSKFDIIFADPPYNLNSIAEIPKMVLESTILNPSGWLIIEHGNMLKLNLKQGFFQQRNYGQSVFSFFRFDNI